MALHKGFPRSAFAGSLLLSLGLGLAGCKKSNSYVPPPPPQVSVATPLVHDVQRHIETTGNVNPLNSVDLVARIQGFLYSQNYTDGATVAKGTTLFTIEPPPYFAQLQQAQANEAAAQANLLLAQQTYARQAQLRKQNVNSQADLDTAQAKRDAAQADLANTTATTQLAAINYSYTQVKAPFDGRVSAHLVSVGQMVGTGGQQTKLATIVQLKPIYVDFSLSEPIVQQIRAALRARGQALTDVHDVPIAFGLQTETGFPHVGELNYIAPTVDGITGTLAARAIYNNDDLILMPGEFVRVRIPLGIEKNALLVPTTALGSDQGGKYVLTIGADNKVQEVSVMTSFTVGDLTVVTQGLKSTDKVIVDGLQRAIPGEAVSPEAAPPIAVPADLESVK